MFEVFWNMVFSFSECWNW